MMKDGQTRKMQRVSIFRKRIFEKDDDKNLKLNLSYIHCRARHLWFRFTFVSIVQNKLILFSRIFYDFNFVKI